MRFWFGRTDDTPGASLTPAAMYLRTLGLACCLWGIFAAALVVALADSELRSIAWVVPVGVVTTIGWNRELVPGRRTLPDAPTNVPVASFALSARALLGGFPMVAGFVGAVWLVDQVVGVKQALVPGLLLGMGIAHLLVAAWIGVWQRREGRRVLIGDDVPDERRLFAAA